MNAGADAAALGRTDAGSTGVSPSSGRARLAAGAHFACVVLADQVLCWGRNDVGQLGDGTMEPRQLAAPVRNIHGAQAVAAGGSHACALANERVYCWGGNSSGQLGNADLSPRPSPVALPVDDAVAVWVGFGVSCVKRQSGSVWCVGNNSAGQLGDPKLGPAVVELTELRAPGEIVSVSNGVASLCVATADGAVYCRGENASGQLGTGGDASATFARVLDIADAIEISGGFTHVCASRRSGQVSCWGWNMYGQLGDGSTMNRSRPVPVTGLGDVVATESGFRQTCALTRAGRTLCWGRNAEGQFGNGATAGVVSTAAGAFNGLQGVALTQGETFGCVMTGPREIYCAGSNSSGQLGDGTGGARTSPVKVKLP